MSFIDVTYLINKTYIFIFILVERSNHLCHTSKQTYSMK